MYDRMILPASSGLTSIEPLAPVTAGFAMAISPLGRNSSVEAGHESGSDLIPRKHYGPSEYQITPKGRGSLHTHPDSLCRTT